MTGFNPVLGFLTAATTLLIFLKGSLFGFNPVLGFLTAATPSIQLGDRFVQQVSIPFWVF